MGGTCPAPSARVGIGMVLVHEVQHANQAGAHSSNEVFYTHRSYESRPCEKEARALVDSNIRSIVSMLAPQMMESCPVGFSVDGIVDHKDGVEDVADLLEELPEVTMVDMLTELRLSGINSQRNVRRLRECLLGRGTNVI